MARKGRTAEAAPEVGVAPALPTFHALYELADVQAALGRSDEPAFLGDPEECQSDRDGMTERKLLRRLLDAGEGGRWRTLAHPDEAAVDAVRALDARAPHMRAVTEAVLRRLLAARAIGLPIRLPPTLLLGPPGVGKSWYLNRLAEALRVPFRRFPVALASLADGLSGSHPVWKAAAPGLVAKTLLREAVANPLILVDELDKPPAASVVGDLYRPLHMLLEPGDARAFVDEYLGMPIDASAVLWVASANATASIPAPILDRLAVVEVGPMGPDERVAVVMSLHADLNRAARDFFDDVPPPAVVDKLAATTPRRARLALDDAMTRAAAAGRRTLRPSDVDLPDRLVPAAATPRRKGVH